MVVVDPPGAAGTIQAAPSSVRALIAQMSKHGLDGVIATSAEAMAYLTGGAYARQAWSWQTHFIHELVETYSGEDYWPAIGIFTNERSTPFVVESFGNAALAPRICPWVKDVRLFSNNNVHAPVPDGVVGEFGETSEIRTSIDCLADALLERGLEAATIGLETRRVPFALVSELQQRLPGVRIVEAGPALHQARLIKSSAEVAKLRYAGDTTAEAFRRIRTHLATGGDCYGIYQTMNQVAIEQRCVFRWEHILFGSDDLDIVRGSPPDYRPAMGEQGIVDLGVSYEGYFGDYARTISIGRPSPATTRIYDSMRSCYDEIAAAIKPGVVAERIFQVGWQAAADHGIRFLISCLGHGIGIGLHEAPYFRLGDMTQLEEGMVLTIELIVLAPGIGPFLLENVGVVTPNGHSCLTQLGNEILEVHP